MSHLICSNPECSPLAPFTGTRLVRRYADDPFFLICPTCRGHYDKEIAGISCPKCGTTMRPAKVWFYECPRCHT
jgi:Zn-finger nucleic acid-binding protein